MGNYSKAAIAAYSMIIERALTPRDAWNEAIASVTKSLSARKKGCPRATFLALAYCGYLKDVISHQTLQRHTVLASRAIAAADLVLSHPAATHRYLSDALGYVDKQGAYDIVIELAKNGFLTQPR
ncbi:conserved hypothetical protein [Dickeya parazeae Ech586]|uniref:Uncharacterized protein n=1 Tax=Dickeya zeae (strain Ech586) TaxID=590409 RepID=D2BW28_DICZ5|nr:hypothetical protein [Dickeya parazeae]ACZ76198.1 conserved hypothetical protein [Dickeya parazeae Ech586]